MEKPHAFTLASVETLGRELGVKFDTFAPLDLQIGMDVELEHGTKGPLSGTFNVTNDDITTTAKIALAHLTERGDYYQRLPAVEGDRGFILFWSDIIKLVIVAVLIVLIIYYFWSGNTPTKQVPSAVEGK
jgi:hypothetical protein